MTPAAPPRRTPRRRPANRLRGLRRGREESAERITVMDDALNAAVEQMTTRGPDVSSLWRHRDGGVYEVVCNAIRESDLVPVVVYRASGPQPVVSGRKRYLGLAWTRPLAEFLDGRFVMVGQA
jgi:hypothetical protein